MSDRIKEFKDLQFLFNVFLKINFNDIQINHFDKSIPFEIMELYGIREKFLKLHPEDKLFKKQDELIDYDKLNLDSSVFDFIIENQGNWTIQTERNKESPKVFIDNDEIISDSLTDFLITYTLQELTFSLEFVDYGNSSSEEIKKLFSTIEPLWTNKRYVWDDCDYNYYLIDDDCLFMEVEGTNFFATNTERKFALL